MSSPDLKEYTQTAIPDLRVVKGSKTLPRLRLGYQFDGNAGEEIPLALRYKYQRPDPRTLPKFREEPDDELSFIPYTFPDQITSALQTRLAATRPDDYELLERASIYEQSIKALRSFIEQSQRSDQVVAGALGELSLLTFSLGQLFSGNFALKLRHSTHNQQAFSGYLGHGVQNLRVIITQNIDDIPTSGGPASLASCQIYFNQTEGINSRGKAIGGADERIRCGLRSWFEGGQAITSVGIDSGIYRRGKNTWNSIYPLSQMAKLYNQGRPIPDSYSYAFHYDDPKSRESRERIGFKTFNFALNRVLGQMAR